MAQSGNNVFPRVPPTADVTTSQVWSARARNVCGWPMGAENMPGVRPIRQAIPLRGGEVDPLSSISSVSTSFVRTSGAQRLPCCSPGSQPSPAQMPNPAQSIPDKPLMMWSYVCAAARQRYFELGLARPTSLPSPTPRLSHWYSANDARPTESLLGDR